MVTGAMGLPEKGFSLRSRAWLELVWMLSVTAVAGLPAATVAGEKVAVAPGGRPLTLKLIASGRMVAPVPGLSIRLKLAVPPGVVLAVLLPEPVPRVNPAIATVTLVVTVAAAKFPLAA
jgi:hypothetical protein